MYLTQPSTTRSQLKKVDACEICGAGGLLHIDHDHHTGLVRGKVCPQCNHGLGHCENAALLWLMAEYAFLGTAGIDHRGDVKLVRWTGTI
jgi:hypothetical protein